MSTQVLIETSEFNVVTAATQGPKGSTAEEFWEVRDQVTLSADLAKDSELAAKTSELAAKDSELAAKDSELAALDSANTAAEASRLQLGMVTTEESGTASAQILGPAGQQVLNLGIPRGPTGAGGTIGSFLSALDTTTQPALVPNTPQRLNLNTVVEGVRVALVDGGRIVFYEPGTYSLTFSIQFTNSENNVINRASVWLKHNNEYYPNSASHFDIPALRNAKPGELVATVNFAATASENTWVEVWWEAQSTQVAATTIASTNGTPQAPSVILTVTQVMYTQTADVTPQLESLLGTAVEAKDAAITSAEEALESKQAAQLAELATLKSLQLANAALLESQTQAAKSEQQATKSEQQATTAQQQAQLAASAKESTQALLQAFQGVFLGSFSTDQLAEAFAQASGIVVQDGTMYQNTVTDKFRVYTGVLWQDYDSSAQQLQAAAQLSATSAATSAQEALQSKLAAQGFAQLTASDHEATEAARLHTALDKQQTGLDRTQTGLDASATAEDRIQTGLDRIATGEDRTQTGLDVSTSLDYKNAAEVAAAAALTNSQVAGEHRVAAGGFADSAEQSAIQAQASLQNILNLGDMTFITVEGAGLITRAGVPFVLNLIKRDSYIVYSVAATGGAVTLEDETITYIGTELGTQTITISAGAATRVLTIEVVSNELGTAPNPAPNIGDPLEGGFYTGNIIDTATTATGSFTLSVSAITLTIPPADLPKFYIGQQIRLGADPVQGGSSAGLAEGVVIAGTGNQLSLDITNVLVGSGSTFSSWIIAIGWKIIIAPRAQGENAGVQWKTSNTAGPVQTQTLTNGPLATSSMIALNTDTIIYPLAKWILDTNATGINGYSDWYIPARDELELIWRNLKPITNANSVGARAASAITYNRDANISTLGQQGTNDNSIPTGVAYTSDIPAQTSVVVFRTGGVEAMQNAVYWSSSEFSSYNAWYQTFTPSGPGNQYGNAKAYSNRARALRRSIL